MQKNTLAYLQNTAFLGGIGTGCLKLYRDGGTQFAGLSKSSSKKEHPGEHLNPVSFAVCVKSAETEAAGYVLKNPEAEAIPASRILPHAPVCRFDGHFPFTEIAFDTASYGIDTAITAFNPFILHNSIDSGIPAAFFEVLTSTISPFCST